MLSIHLESDSLYLYGSPEESAGTEIRGCLELTFKESTRVKSISLQFMGLLKQNWTEGLSNVSFSTSQRRQTKWKKAIYQHDWTFLPEGRWPHNIKANTTYRYPFNLGLPGHIAESITCDSSGGMGSLTYQFKATVTRPFATKNIVVHRSIQVIRKQPSFGYNFYRSHNDNSRVINKTFGDKVNYCIKLDTDIYQRGQPIRIHFIFKPLVQSLRIQHISCFLKEYTTLTQFTDNDDNDDARMDQLSVRTPLQQNQQSRIISLARDDRFSCDGNVWEETETVVVPRSARSVQLDMDHPLMRIEHKLRLTVCFVQLDGHQSELRVTLPIKILEPNSLSSSHSPTSTEPVLYEDTTPHLLLDDLPRYEEACLTVPYDPQHRFWYSPSDPASPSPSLPSLISNYDTPSPSYNNHDGENWLQQQFTTTLSDHSGPSSASPCDYFSYQPSNHPIYLQHPPSYSTVIRS
ncbi:hypothetical protein BCR42DRAFT_373574 [Absidia repens]|uniref:Arrestin C-terminal-like domain-containing protein n=1 Tax=Absidia repens TaxID=90262 RepID=A0A1X2IM31_9FUNG|nr:hypothetical protein BCR42DRAFT_373574 [Absidia repens]